MRPSHEETATVEVPCPGISVVTQDEDGYTYLGNFNYSSFIHQYDPSAPEPCIARLTPDNELDESFTTTLTALTNGNYGAMFQYVRNGWGLMSVLHHDELGADFDSSDGTIPADVLEASWDSNHWEVWVIDLKRQEAHPVEGLEGVRGYLNQGSISSIDGRSFLQVPYKDSADARRTKRYELSDGATATEIDDFDGEGKWTRLR